MRSSRLVAVGAVLALLATGCLANPPPDAGPPANSPTLNAPEDLVTGLDRPWDISFVPNTTTALFTERGGRLSLFDSTVGAASKKLLGTVANVFASGESGLMGLAVDPDFATNHYVYVCVSSTAPSPSNQIRRITVDLNAQPGSGLVADALMLQGMPVNNFHDGCRVRFQPNTSPPALWITMGDAGIGTAPQDPNSLGGKILRVDVSSGTLLPYLGNPAGVAPNPVTRLIYTYGHRNPQGIAFQPGTNVPYNSEHGPTKNDEVNRLVSGGNGGWNPVPGYNQNVVMTDVFTYKDAMRPVWRSGQTSTVAPSGISFIENRGGVDWQGWNGTLAVGFLKDMSVRIMSINAQGGVSNVYRTLTNLGSRLRSIVEGPDGALYIATDNGSPNDRIWRVTPA